MGHWGGGGGVVGIIGTILIKGSCGKIVDNKIQRKKGQNTYRLQYWCVSDYYSIH